MQQEEIRENYDRVAVEKADMNLVAREHSLTYDLKSFNNWIKAVLIRIYTQQMCSRLQNKLDLRRQRDSKILHVLDIGCGRGQDIQKWRKARVSYMVATDFSSQCIKGTKGYEQRWSGTGCPYKLYTHVGDFTKTDLYHHIEHSYYDVVSAQFSFHYMFGTQIGLKNGLASILSNLLVEGVFIATVPDSYTILKKVKTKGKQD